MTVGGMNVREALHIKKVEMLWTFSVRGGGSNSFHSYWGVFPDITKPILYDENSKQSQNLPTKNDHFAPKLMSFYCQGQVSPKMVIYGFFGEMSRAAGTRFKKKDPLKCS